MAGEWDDLASGYARGFYDLALGRLGRLELLDRDRGGSEGGPLAGKRVLDFGCGTGLLTSLLRRRGGCQDVVAVDVSPKMIEVLDDKIRGGDWKDVRTYCLSLADLEEDEGVDDSKAAIKSELLGMYGTFDVVFASSVLTFIPEEDIAKTMSALGKMLKPGGSGNAGVLVHSDWPKSEAKRPDAMTAESAERMYEMAGLRAISSEVVPMDTTGCRGGSSAAAESGSAAAAASTVEVFLGVAGRD